MEKIRFTWFHQMPKTFLYIFFVVGIFGVLIMSTPQVEAATATTSLTITNALPVASNVNINSSATDIVLTSGTTTTVTATFTVTDNNGCADIDSGSSKTTAVFYRTTVS